MTFRRRISVFRQAARNGHGIPISAPARPFVHKNGKVCGRRAYVTPRQTCPQPNGFGRNLRSKTRWFTGFCNSHQVSHFATFFIDVRAEISVAESHYKLIKKTTPVRAQREPKPDRRTLFHFPWRIPRRFFVVSGRPGGRKLATGAPPTSNEHRAAPTLGRKGAPRGGRAWIPEC